MGRPSDERRAFLRSADQDVSSFPISNFCPIQRYYSAASKALEAFDEAYYCMNLDKAYSLGRRFASFSTEVLPKHDYYKSPDSSLTKLKKKNQNDIIRVLDLMERIVALMDEEEVQKKKKQEEEERLRLQAELEELKKQQELASTSNLADKLKSLDVMFPKVPVGVGETQLPPPPPELEPDLPNELIDETSVINVTNPTSIPLSLDDLKPMLPPPIPMAATTAAAAAAIGTVSTTMAESTQLPPPPSYADLMKQKPPPTTAPTPTNTFWDVSSNSPDAPSSNDNLQQVLPQNPQQPLSSTISVQSRLADCRRDYEKLCNQNRIEVFYLSTFQGRVTHIPSKDSTNGCTVISPLVASMHLQSDELGITNSNIARVIDDIAPPILLKVRKKLGLGLNAFIIPSDVHDFLVDQNIILQDQFVGVSGGNILDDDHTKGFLQMLETGVDDTTNNKQNHNKNIKVAAALFFHEHVVSIVKTVQSNGSRSFYDLVDSMPDRRSNSATRTRSKDMQSFKVLLNKYALTKFSQNELDFIDKNKWNADMCDFDPRVFQAFVWKE